MLIPFFCSIVLYSCTLLLLLCCIILVLKPNSSTFVSKSKKGNKFVAFQHYISRFDAVRSKSEELIIAIFIALKNRVHIVIIEDKA